MKLMKRRIYLDHASTTPVDKRVLKAMLPYMSLEFGNPSSLYKEGVEAKKAVRESRDKIAKILNIRAEEVIFTASGTESDNLAISGVIGNPPLRGVPSLRGGGCHIITTNIEHPGILEMCKHLETNGVEVTYVPVEDNGIVDSQKIAAAIKHNTVLVSVMLANNEIGTIQPIREISNLIKKYREGSKSDFPYLHTDASQAANYLDLSFQKLGVDMMTLDGSKICGPKGIGVLAVRRGVPVMPIIFGGGQENGLRAGTENVPGIVGMSEAFVIAQEMKEKESNRLLALKEYFF